MMRIKIGQELRPLEDLSNRDIIELVRQSMDGIKTAGKPLNIYQIPLGRGYFGTEECEWYLEFPKKIFYKPNTGLPIVTKSLQFGSDEWNEYVKLFEKKEGKI